MKRAGVWGRAARARRGVVPGAGVGPRVLSRNSGDGVRGQAGAVWGGGGAGSAAK